VTDNAPLTLKCLDFLEVALEPSFVISNIIGWCGNIPP